MIHAGGREWYTANEVPEMWPDVTPGMIRLWQHRGRVNGVRMGNRTYYDINQLTEAEHAARNSPRGQKRGMALTSENVVP